MVRTWQGGCSTADLRGTLRADGLGIVSLLDAIGDAVSDNPNPLDDAVWVVEDEPAAAELAADLCEASGARASLFRGPLQFLAALRGRSRPAAVVLDWRLEHELSAALFLATRHRFPGLPVIYWTGSHARALPAMIRNDRLTRIVDKAGGSGTFETALGWAMAQRQAIRSDGS
jgi:CheY-like chemotaxis protein